MEMLNCAVGCCLLGLTVTNPCSEGHQEHKEDVKENLVLLVACFQLYFFLFSLRGRLANE